MEQATSDLKGFGQIILTETLSLRQKKNPRYSLRSFSKDIGLAPAVVSDIINGKRRVPKNSLNHVIEKLNLSPIQSMLLRSNREDFTHNRIEKILTEERHYKIIAEWEYYAILELFELDNFPKTESPKALETWAIKKLGISSGRFKTCLEGLLKGGLILLDSDGNFRKRDSIFTSNCDVPSQALRASHKESLDIAKEKLYSTPLEKRSYTSTTVAIDPDKISEAEQLIRNFRRELSALLSSDKKKEVYQICLQLFPLTKETNIET